MNIILGVCSFFLCLVMANITLDKHSKRAEFYRNFHNFHNTLNNEISFNQSTIKKLADKLEYKTDFEKYVKNYFDNNQQEVDYKYLDSNEQSFLKNYFNSLGVGDKYTQLNALNVFESEIIKKKNDYSESAKKYRSVYIKLGVLFGIIAFIIFI